MGPLQWWWVPRLCVRSSLGCCVSDELLFCQTRGGGKRLRHGGRSIGQEVELGGRWQRASARAVAVEASRMCVGSTRMLGVVVR